MTTFAFAVRTVGHSVGSANARRISAVVAKMISMWGIGGVNTVSIEISVSCILIAT